MMSCFSTIMSWSCFSTTMGKTKTSMRKQEPKEPKPQSIDRISQLPEPIQHNILNFLEEDRISQLPEPIQHNILNFLEEDRISQLPQPIQHNILNFLEEKAVARTRVLSKAWRSIVHSRPVVDFKYEPYYAEGMRSRDRIFINYVNESMQTAFTHGRSLQRLRLLIERRDSSALDLWAHALNHWMQQSVEAKVNDLTLVLDRTLHHQNDYVLPPFVLLSETITRLRLERCGLEQCSNVSLPNILVLSLSDVALTHEMVEKFQSGCPNLEVLKLYRCNGLSSICVSGLARLRQVELILCNSVNQVRIVAPKLRVFKVSHDSCNYCHYTKIDLLACESTLRKLSFSSIKVTERLLRHFVSKFLELESLTLGYLDVKIIAIANKKLRKLKVESCSKLERIKTSRAINLRALTYSYNKLPFYWLNSSFTLDDTAQFLATFLIKNMFESLSESYFEQVLLQFNRLGNLKLIVLLDHEDVIVYEELDENFIAMLHLLKVYPSRYNAICVDITRTTSYEYMIDFMFGCFHYCHANWLGNMKTLSIVSRKERNNKKVLEVLTENALKENEEPNCCGYESYKCYRHLLSKNQLKEKEDSTCCCKTNAFKCWKHVLYNAKMIYGRKAKASNWFKSFDTKEYDITHIELEWNTFFC